MFNILLPFWAKYAAGAVLIVSVWGHGYVTGLSSASEKAIALNTDRVILQTKVTTKVITKYIKQKEATRKITEEIKQDAQNFTIKFPSIGDANNEFVWLYDKSIENTIPALPSGELGDSSGISYSQVLNTSIHNNSVGKEWKERALLCEAWAKEQEEVK